MPPFAFSSLVRRPDVEASDLQAWDATDILLVDRALALAAAQDIGGAQIAVVGDGYGAITLALTDAGLAGVRVHQDLATGRRALARNAEQLGIAGFEQHELDEALLADARLVLLQLPKSLAELEEIADAVARWAASDVVLVAGGRVKHMTLAQNEVLGRSFAHVQAERAERKSRLIVASEPRPIVPEPPFPVSTRHDGFTLVAHGGVFAGTRIDIGTRVLLDVLGLGGSQLLENDHLEGGSALEQTDAAVSCGVANADLASETASDLVIDLGCGSGALAVAYALAHPDARVVATDRSAAAVASTRATVIANGLGDRITVTHDDAGSELPDGCAGTVLLNPPFHLGTSIHTAAATRLFEAAARLLRPGGELWTVYNSPLAYKSPLTRIVGPTEQVHRTSKFTVTRSIRR